MGLPGSLPRLNQDAVKKATLIAMALNCSTPEKIAFFRKNYFYPDLPKNFQITQLNIYGDTSVGGSGSIMVDDKKINITRIQLMANSMDDKLLLQAAHALEQTVKLPEVPI